MLLKFFRTIAKPYLKWFVALLFVGLYSSVHNVVQPYILKLLLDAVARTAVSQTLVAATDSSLPSMATKLAAGQFWSACLPLGLALMALGLLINLVWRFYNYIALRIFPRMKADIINLTTKHLWQKEFGFFQDNLSGALSTKIADLTSNIQSIANSWFNIARQSLTVLLSIAMAGLVSPYFSLIFLLMSVVFIGLSSHCARSIKPYASAFAEARSKNIGTIVDCFANILNMLLFARASYEAKYLEQTTKQAMATDTAMQFKNMLNAILLGSFAWLLSATTIMTLLYLGSKGLVSVGDFAFIFILSITVIDQVWFLTESLLVLGEQVGVCESALVTIFNNVETLDYLASQQAEVSAKQSEVPTANNMLAHNDSTNIALSLQNLSFGYKSGFLVLSGLNFDLPIGAKIGLVGSSGAGKSTLVNLIMRLFETNTGEILLHGQNIKLMPTELLRKQIAFIPQEPSLFHRSIYENILYGDITADYEQVILAAQQANAHEFISALPNGYETVVGERGLKLSGGQRQRIAIARAILKNAPILILDEATSALDSVTERYIQQSLQLAMAKRTVLVIAHRLATILTMDKILVLEQGKIVEVGSHYELIAANGIYKKLWDTQSGLS